VVDVEAENPGSDHVSMISVCPRAGPGTLYPLYVIYSSHIVGKHSDTSPSRTDEERDSKLVMTGPPPLADHLHPSPEGFAAVHPGDPVAEVSFEGVGTITGGRRNVVAGGCLSVAIDVLPPLAEPAGCPSSLGHLAPVGPVR